jgi:hypothetical protein
VTESAFNDCRRGSTGYGLTAGDYTIWNDDTTPVGTMAIHGTQVTEVTAITRHGRASAG